jgi:transcriptional regulator with XRE-family HTH domain
MAQDEIQRLLHVLRVAMRILDVSNRDIEKKLGFSYGYLSRLFAGSIELKVEHVLQILEVLGLTPAEFFQLAYPRKTAPPSEAAVRMKDILEGIGPLAPEERPGAAEVSSEQIEQVVSAMLRKMLKDAKA